MTGNPIRKTSREAGRSAWLMLLAAATGLHAADGPFFITYTHQMEEPRNLELNTKNVTGRPGDGNRFLGTAAELEYGLKGWWTTELYLDGQSTRGENTLFTGYRWENRFRVLAREHWINPVLYVEFENINGADKSLLEVVGHDGVDDLTAPSGDSRHEKQREIEAKLILGSYFKGWTIAENFIAEKNLSHAPYEFGYAAGISRPLALSARADRCNFCLENLQAGVEVYGGLGDHIGFGMHETSHYVAPALAWTLANGTTFRVSPGFGVTDTSARFLLRVGVSYEIAQFGRAAHNLFRRGASMKRAKYLLAVGVLGVAWCRAASPVQQAPPSAAGRSNPLESKEQARRAGAKLYARECAACHGANRQGHGKAPSLNRPEVYQASPGALFWVLRNGSLHTGMPSFAHLPEPERWQIVTWLLHGNGSATADQAVSGKR